MVKAKSHLLKHEVPETVDSVHHFGTDDKKEITRRVAAMGQRQLQEKFKLVYQTNTGSNNNNWLRRKLLEAAGCQEAKVIGMGNSSPRKKGIGMGELGMDGGASYRTENGMRRTKRPRKPKQNTDYIGDDAFEGGRHREGGPLSSGDAYLQERTALYKASQTLGLPAGHDFPFTNIITGKHFAGHNPFNINQPFHEVQWPGPSQRGRPDESNSSSEDQTAYEHSHSHHSHQSREPRVTRPASPRTQLNRNLEDTMTLLTNHGMVPNSRAQLRMHASLPGGLPSMPGVPGLSWDDPMRYPFTASAPAKFGGQPGSPSTAYLAQMLRQSSGNQDERVGGNTPLLDLEDPLLDGGYLGHSSATDSFLTGGLPTFEGNLLPSASNSPILSGTDFANMFSDTKALDMSRPLLTSQGLGLIDLPTAGRLSSLERLLGDVSPSHMLSDARLHMPSAPPPTPVSHGLTSPRYHGALEGMAAPSQRFTGAHHPSGLSLQSYGKPALAPAFMSSTTPPPASPRAAGDLAPVPRFNLSTNPGPTSPRAGGPAMSPRFLSSTISGSASPRAGKAPRFASSTHPTPASPRASPGLANLVKQQRSMSVEPPEQRMQLPPIQSMAVRTLSTPEPLPSPQMELPAHDNLSNPLSIHSVPSLGAWNITEYPHLKMPDSSQQAGMAPRNAPTNIDLQAQLQSMLGAQLPGPAGPVASAQGPAQQVASPTAQPPMEPDQAFTAAEKTEAARLHAESAALPTIAEEDPTRAPTPAEGESAAPQ